MTMHRSSVRGTWAKLRCITVAAAIVTRKRSKCAMRLSGRRQTERCKQAPFNGIMHSSGRASILRRTHGSIPLTHFITLTKHAFHWLHYIFTDLRTQCCFRWFLLRQVVIRDKMTKSLRYDTIRYDILFALKNWQASCQFNLAHFSSI